MKHHEQFGPGIKAIIIRTHLPMNRWMVGKTVMCTDHPVWSESDGEYAWTVTTDFDSHAHVPAGYHSVGFDCNHLIPVPDDKEFDRDHQELKKAFSKPQRKIFYLEPVTDDDVDEFIKRFNEDLQ